MNTRRMLTPFVAAVFLWSVLAVLPRGAALSAAQKPEPPCLPDRSSTPATVDGNTPRRADDGTWYMPQRRRQQVAANASAAHLSTGGPDEFGYTWDDSVPLDWLDARSGTDTGMSGDSWDQAVGPISLPFSFKYYENTYSQVYIAAAGYLAFAEADTWYDQDSIPAPGAPNNVIAPYWTPIYIGAEGWVRYASGGTTPNAYFVVEWHDVRGGAAGDDIGEDELYRFQLVLREGGDIVFQYQTMDYTDDYWCGAAGVEDAEGLDGLYYVDFCAQAPDTTAVRFYRPPPSARVRMLPLHQGTLTQPGETVSFEVPVRNTGDLGADTYDLTLDSTWPASLYASDGTTPLSDTDGDGVVDTGSVVQGGQFDAVVKVEAPAGSFVGDSNAALLTARSSVDTSVHKAAHLRNSIPGPFSQVFRDNDDGAQSFHLVQPVTQRVTKVTSDGYYGYDGAVAEAASGDFAYFWDRGRSAENEYVTEIEFVLLKPVEKGELAQLLAVNHFHAEASSGFEVIMTA